MKKISAFFIFLSMCSAQPSFRFAHITDTHVGSSTGAEDLRRTVADLNAGTGISFAVISGDITEFGSDEQLRLAKAILDSLTIPWYIIPGNHDMKWGGSGGTSFRKIFGDERFFFAKEQYVFIGVHEGPRLRMGDGHFAPEDLRWVKRQLSSLKNKKNALFVVTHYPLDNGIANWYEMISLLKQYNVQAVLVGHGHANRLQNYEGIPGVMGRSNLRAKDTVGGYNIVEIRNDSMIYSTRTPLGETQKPWCTVPLGMRNYSRDTASYPRPDFSINDHFPGIRTVWKYNSGYTITSTPVFVNGQVIFGDGSGQVTSISLKNKKVHWSFKTGDAVYSSPAVSGSNVYFGSCDSFFYSLDAIRGKLRWKYKTGAAIVSSPTISGDKVFFGGSDRTFYALDEQSGKLLWRYDSLLNTVEAKPLIIGGNVLFGAWDEYLYCLNSNNGSLVWKWRGDRRGILLSPAACTPVSANGKVFIAAPDRFLTAIDIITGKQLWRTNEFQVRETIGLSEDGERLYVRTMTDSLYALSTSSLSPEIVWKLNAGFGYDINSAQIVEKNGMIFYPTKNGLLLAIDGKSGKLIWKKKVGVGVTNTILPISGKQIVVTDFDGNVISLHSK